MSWGVCVHHVANSSLALWHAGVEPIYPGWKQIHQQQLVHTEPLKIFLLVLPVGFEPAWQMYVYIDQTPKSEAKRVTD